jgi:spore coat polysaccharide biosynthesis protein SpsF
MTHRFTIDYAEDYQFIRKVYEELYPVNPLFSMGDILGLLHLRPEIYAINAAFAGVNWYRHHLDELKTVGKGQTRHAMGSAATGEVVAGEGNTK